eukprot:NODE_1510_length_531_cov_91.707469_g1433_i0.p2 GENE.NODE_1510_length_531_cov_91.707469_g1433_i0~~NODE_1510_length_531_cov_91.707469_g1433_i0.p2  ORF type:complete len:123 (+),score=15.15 NODE_1510_length_531_cov_91.707469_g1433_i0:63-431(+)
MQRIMRAVPRAARLVPLQARAFNSSNIPTRDELRARVFHIVEDWKKTDAPVEMDAHFTDDLGMDSLDKWEMLDWVTKEFLIWIPQKQDYDEGFQTVRCLYNYLAMHPQAGNRPDSYPHWDDD